MADPTSRCGSRYPGWWAVTTACLSLFACSVLAAPAPLCLYVSSYHQGHAWSDGIERGLRQTIAEHCEVASFYMDSSRRPSVRDMQSAGLAAFERARDLQPDIIITSDDNAAEYLIVPYLLGGKTPVVFSGINWSVQEYGLPSSNVTGMVEVAPLRHMLINTLTAVQSSPDHRILTLRKQPGAARILYLGSDSPADLKMLARIDLIANLLGTGVDSILVDDFDAWLSGFRLAQNHDLLIIGNNANVRDFDHDVARRHALLHTRTLSVTYNDWMMDYAVLGYTRLAEEQGEWAALAAIAILDGLPPSDIPVVTNRKFETWLNVDLAERSGLRLSPHITNRAKKYQ
ncbi:ABC transporter substrate-binding protein [Granulosicoccus sp. 3-233]|uniref:ABC transporter substrate-binding protein n=1 Tax=Granulosicoccus sp. 3-233 TaxID=3417969 RepID=UPI003D325A58